MIRFPLILLALAIVCSISAQAGQTATDHAIYRESTGNRQETFTWELAGGESPVLITSDSRESFRTRLSPDLQALAWEITRPAEKTCAKAWRDGHKLRIQGELQGKPLAREFAIDDTPWLQSLSVSLLRHLPSTAGQREFWIIRPDTLEPQRMQVSDVTEEVVTFSGESVATWRVEIRPAGLLSVFWKGNYWFRKADRRFIRFRGASGPPGTPDTEISLLDNYPVQANTTAVAPR